MAYLKGTSLNTQAPPDEVFLVANSGSALKTGAGNLRTSQNVYDVDSKQLAILSERLGIIDATGDIVAGQPILLAQGTPKSRNLSSVDPMGAGDRGLVRTNLIDPNGIKEIVRAQAALPKASMVTWAPATAQIATGTPYTVRLQARSPRLDREFGLNRLKGGVTVTVPSGTTNPRGYLLAHLADKINKLDGGKGLWKAFVASSVSTTGIAPSLVIDDFTITNTVNWVAGTDTSGNTTSITFGAPEQMAIASAVLKGALTTGFVFQPYNVATSGSVAAAAYDTLVVIGLRQGKADGRDEVWQAQVRVDVEVPTSFTARPVVASAKQDARGFGDDYRIRYERRAGLNILTQERVDCYGYFIDEPNYIDTSVYYSSLIVSHDSTVAKTLDHAQDYRQIALILYPTSINTVTYPTLETLVIASTAAEADTLGQKVMAAYPAVLATVDTIVTAAADAVDASYIKRDTTVA